MSSLKERYANGGLTLREKIIEKVVGGIILAVIISSLTIWRNQAVIEAKFDAVCTNIVKVEESVKDLTKQFIVHLGEK